MCELGVSGRDGLSAARRPKGMRHVAYERLWHAAVDALFDEYTAFERALRHYLGSSL